jgi:hypothetical protein
MAKFKAKNENKSTFFQAGYRSKYKREAFPENNSLGPVGVVDFLFAERNLYGRVDQNLNVVVPNQSSIKRVVSAENPAGTPLMNFVADQFIDFQRTFERALNGGKIRQNDPFLSKPRIYSSYSNPKAAYEEYFSNVMINFENIFLDKRKTISAEDYFGEFLRYINQITPTFPLTYTAWHRSRYSSIFHSGLAIDLSGQNIGTDELKEAFIESENFPYYLNVCNNFGFSVAKNSPWIIVADLASPSSTVYHTNYGLSSVNQIFSQNFLMTSEFDVDYVKRNLFDSYNNFVNRFPYEKNIIVCNKNTIKNNIYRYNINIDKFNNIYNNNYFIEYYNNIRYFEENKPFSQSDQKKISQNAKNLQKIFDNSRAIGYINEQYRSVYKSKPGGLNHVLKRTELKKR